MASAAEKADGAAVTDAMGSLSVKAEEEGKTDAAGNGLTADQTRQMSDDEFFAAYKAGKVKRREDAWTEDNWEEQLENTPMFMTHQPTPKEFVENPQLAAMTQIFHDTFTPEERATTHKEQGNEQYKKGLKAAGQGKAQKVFFHEAIKCYTEGLKEDNKDMKLRGVLLTNRAAVNLLLRNYGRVRADCAEAVKLDEKNIKAYYRHVCASNKLEQYAAAIEWADRGLSADAKNVGLASERQKAVKAKALLDRKTRKDAAQARKMAKTEAALAEALAARGVTTATRLSEEDSGLAEASLSKGPRLDQEGFVHWPVLFAYPESAQTDFIEDCLETHCLLDHLNVMFPDDSPGPCVPWDTNNAYKSSRIAAYYEATPKTRGGRKQLVRVDTKRMVGSALSEDGNVVYDGTAVFLLLVEGSAFQREFLARYS